MSLTETVIEGTIRSDGTLVLDEKVNMPAGRVTVVVRRTSEMAMPNDDPFLLRLQAIWAIPRSPCIAVDGGANTLEEVRRGREEWDEHQSGLESFQQGANP